MNTEFLVRPDISAEKLVDIKDGESHDINNEQTELYRVLRV